MYGSGGGAGCAAGAGAAGAAGAAGVAASAFGASPSAKSAAIGTVSTPLSEAAPIGMVSSSTAATGIGSDGAAPFVGSTPLRSDLHCSQNSAPSSFSKLQNGHFTMTLRTSGCFPYGAGEPIWSVISCQLSAVHCPLLYNNGPRTTGQGLACGHFLGHAGRVVDGEHGLAGHATAGVDLLEHL